MINREKRNKTLNEVGPVENTSRNPQRFLKTSPVQKEVLLCINCKTIHMRQNPFRLQEDNLSHRNCLNHLSLPSLPHIEQEYQESLIQVNIQIQQN